MDVENPKHHEGNFGSADEDFNQQQIARWVIDVPKGSKSIFYSIALASLLQAAQNEEDFEVKFEALFGQIQSIDSKQLQEVKQLIKRFNPFLNKYACHRDQVLKTLTKEFKYRIRNCIFKSGNEIFNDYISVVTSTDFAFNPIVDGGEAVMNAACHILRCKIVLLSPDEQKPKLFSCCDEINSRDLNILTLYRENASSGKNKFHFRFGIDTNTGLYLQKLSLNVLLGRAAIPRNIREKISLQDDLQTDLLKSLLINKNLGTIKVLYRQRYIISKLSEAGYKMDPISEDADGKSGFFYAMENGNFETIRLLYDYLSGSFNWIDCSPRNPDQCVLGNLEKLKSFLETLVKTFQEQSKLKRREKKDKITFLQELIKFNHFQADVCKKIIIKRQEFSDTSEKVVAANARKQMIISILSTYEDHSNMSRADSEGAESREVFLHKRYNSYMEYWRFYNTLDITTALLFFDNIFLLKEKLSLADGEYEKADSSFLYFIFCSSCYKETRLSPECRIKIEKHESLNSVPLGKKKLWCIINFLERLKLEECLKGFKDLLVNTNVCNENTTECLPECEAKTLTSLREITDAFILKRMIHYIDLATEVDLEEDWKMGMLLIERALQVMGESITFITKSKGITLLESFLVSSFPLGTKRDIKKIRNLFSHLDRKKLFCRFEVERRPDLFKEVQKDLENIKGKFSNMLDAQILRERLHVFRNGFELLSEQKTVLETLKKSDATEYRKMKSLFSSLLLENQEDPEMLELDDDEELFKDKQLLSIKRDALQKRREENKRQRKDLGKLKTCFKKIEKCLELSLEELNSEELVSKYKNNLDLHIQHLREHVGKAEMYKNSKKVGELVELVNYHLQCIRIVLQTIVEESNCSSKRDLLDGIENLKLTFTLNNDDKISMEKLEEKLETVTDEINLFYQDVIREFKVFKETDPDSTNCIHFPGITKLEELLSGNFYFLTEEEKQIILESLSEECKEIHEAKEILIGSLESGNFLPPEEAAENIKKLKLAAAKCKILERDYDDENMLRDNLHMLEEVKDYFGNLKSDLDNNKELNGKDFETMETFLNSTKAKRLLKRVVKGERLEEDRSLEFLLDRIALIEELMIKSKPYIEASWIAPKGKEATEHVKKKILWCYLQDSKLQAAVEMLLFDCMNLLKKRIKYVNFMRKSARLLTGINLRNVLGHGNPLLETLNQILEPSDLPSELVSRALELITDRELVKTLYERDMLRGESEYERNTPSGFGACAADESMDYSTDEKEEKMKKYLEWLDYDNSVSP